MNTNRKIKIYGAGCNKFFRTVASFRKAAQQCNDTWEIKEISDRKEIAARGPMNLPAVFINDKLIFQGEEVGEEKAREAMKD